MRLLLDAHVSGRAVGKAPTENGHDARAIDSEVELEGMPNPEVLELAASEGRVLVGANVKDFDLLLTEWAVEGRSHAGVILGPPSAGNEAFGALISEIEDTLGDADQGTGSIGWSGSKSVGSSRRSARLPSPFGGQRDHPGRDRIHDTSAASVVPPDPGQREAVVSRIRRTWPGLRLESAQPVAELRPDRASQVGEETRTRQRRMEARGAGEERLRPFVEGRRGLVGVH